MGPKQTTWTWDMPNLDMGHAQPGHGTCPTWTWDMPNLAGDMPNLAWDMPNLAWDMPNLGMGHAQPMGPNGPGPNQWARMAHCPTIGPERPRVQLMGPNGPGSNNWARTAQGPPPSISLLR